MNQYQFLLEKQKAEENLMKASYYLRTYLGQGINLFVVNGDPCTTEALGKGRIRNGFSLSAPYDGAIKTIAIFNRETSDGTVDSDLRPTGIFLEEPKDTVDEGDVVVGGALFFHTRDAGQPIGVNRNTLLNEGVWFDRISNFTVDQVIAAPDTVGIYGACGGVLGIAQEARFTITTRFVKSMQKASWIYSPTSPPAGVAFMDFSEEVVVYFRANNLGPSNSRGDVPQRALGLPYFFPFFPPKINF